MGAQGVQDERVGLQLRDGLLQGAGQAVDPGGGPGLPVHPEDVLRNLGGREHALFDAVQPGGQAHGQLQVGVAGRVGGAQLHPGGLAPGGGNADQGGAVGGRPGQVAGGLVAGHQALVGVDQRIRNRRHALDVAEQARDEGVGLFGQALLPLRVVKHVPAVLEQGHIGVHTRARHAVDGLGHKGGVEAVLLGQELHRQLEGHDIVGGPEGVGVLEVDLVLAGGVFVVAGLNLKAHLLQGHTDLAPGPLAVIQGAQVEVAGLVVGLGGGLALVVGLKQEELGLRPHVEGVVAHGLRPLEHPLEHVPGVAHEGGTVGVVHVADQPGGLVLLVPGVHHEGIQVGIEALVGLVNAHEALHRGAVEHDLVVDRPLNLGGRQRHVLELAENIGELEADEFDLLLLDHADNVFLRVRHSRCPLPLCKFAPYK